MLPRSEPELGVGVVLTGKTRRQGGRHVVAPIYISVDPGVSVSGTTSRSDYLQVVVLPGTLQLRGEIIPSSLSWKLLLWMVLGKILRK